MRDEQAQLLDTDTLHMLIQLGERRGKDLLGQLLELFRSQGPESFQRMAQALEAGDADTIREVAHSLKGSYRSIGTPALAEMAYDLELRARGGRLDGCGQRVDEMQRTFASTLDALEGFIASQDRS